MYGVSWLSQAMVTISTGYFTYDLASVLLRYHIEGAGGIARARAGVARVGRGWGCVSLCGLHCDGSVVAGEH